MKDFKGFGLQKQDVNVTENRNLYVGGSDVPTILGINKYKTQYELALEKTGIQPSEFTGNEYTEYGNKLEPQIREYINKINDTNFIVQTFIDKEKSIRSNVDGIDEKNKVILEIKTHGKNPTLKVYEAQMQLYMAQTGCDLGWLALYQRPESFDIEFDVANLKMEVIERDDEFIQKIYDAIETFQIRCEYLRANPEMTETEFMTFGTGIDASLVKLNKLAPRIIEMKAAAKELEAKEKLLKDEIYEHMEANDIKKLETPLMVVTRVLPSKSTRLNSTQLKKDLPDVFEQYSIETERKGYITLKERKYD